MIYNTKKISVINTPNLTTEWTLKSWLINGPFHMMWDQWTVTLVHLRGECEGEQAKLDFEGATHQLIIQAINPDAKPLDGDSTEDDLTMMIDGQKTLIGLNPIDISQQFEAANDAEAVSKVDILLDMIKNKQLSPDQDFRKLWKHLLTECERVNGKLVQ
jgi:hypothetical protein